MTTLLGFVHIIESPSADDLLDGRTEGRALSEVLDLAKIPYCYNLVTNLETLSIALDTRLLEAADHFGLAPILHLSMHGNKKGVGLTDGRRLLWSDLRTLLAPLTNVMEGELLICMSSCFGSAGCRMARHEGAEPPFGALVGNKESVSWEDAAVAYVTFYHLLFKDIPVDQCVERMKWASDDHNFDVKWGHEEKANWTQRMAKFRRKRVAEVLRSAGQEVRQRAASIR